MHYICARHALRAIGLGVPPPLPTSHPTPEPPFPCCIQSQAGAVNADLFAREPSHVPLLLALLEEEPVGISDFYVRYHTVQLLTGLLQVCEQLWCEWPGSVCLSLLPLTHRPTQPPPGPFRSPQPHLSRIILPAGLPPSPPGRHPRLSDGCCAPHGHAWGAGGEEACRCRVEYGF